MSDCVVRPLTPADVAAARSVTAAALAPLYPDTPPDTPEVVARGQARIAHLQQTDPASSWVAEQDGEVVGCGLALVREGMWFLSLLMVDPATQSQGLGKRLLDATLTTATDRSWILATKSPAALRRYRRAGFDLIPCLSSKGVVDRALIPTTSVHETTWAEHGQFVDETARQVRGAGMAQDLEYCERMGSRLFVSATGFVIVRRGALVQLAAPDPRSAADLLWTAMAEVDGPIEVDWLAHDQQWAIDVCLDARLPLLEGEGHLFLRGQPPMPHYLPGGALG